MIGCPYGLAAVGRAVAVHREGVGVSGNGARRNDGQTDQRAEDDVLHGGSPISDVGPKSTDALMRVRGLIR